MDVVVVDGQVVKMQKGESKLACLFGAIVES